MNLKALMIPFLCLCAVSAAKAQQTHSLYKDSVQVYVKQNQNLTFYLSPDTNFINALPLLKENTHPFSPQKTGTYKLQMSVRNRNIFQASFVSDGVSPVIEFWSVDENKVLHEDKILRGKDFLFELRARDSHSGLENVMYSINNQKYNPYKEKIEIPEEGIYTIDYKASDRVGNESETFRKIIEIDHTPPLVSWAFLGDFHEDVVSSRTQLQLMATDKNGVKAIYWQWNGPAKWNVYTAPLQLGRLTEGHHQLKMYAIDNAGNTSEIQSIAFFMDKTPPLIIEEITGATFLAGGLEYSSGRSQLKITAVDNKAGVKDIYYSINNEDFVRYERPVFLSHWTGTIQIRTYAVDNVNNRSQQSANRSTLNIPVVDLNAPESRHEFLGPQIQFNQTLYIGPQTSIKLSAFDRESGLDRIEYAINNSEFVEYQNEISIKAHGVTNLTYYAYDRVENASRKEIEFFMDSIPPEISYSFSMPPLLKSEDKQSSDKVFPAHVAVFASAFDLHSGFEQLQYSINNADYQNYSGPIRFEKYQGQILLQLRAFDKAGNKSEQEVIFHIQ